jgi:hypothetical protein
VCVGGGGGVGQLGLPGQVINGKGCSPLSGSKLREYPNTGVRVPGLTMSCYSGLYTISGISIGVASLRN